MIKHIVMWKLKASEEKLENAAKIKADLEALVGVIPQLKSAKVEFNSPLADASNYDVALIAETSNFADLKTYATHPAHIEVGKFIKTVVESRVCIDYEF